MKASTIAFVLVLTLATAADAAPLSGTGFTVGHGTRGDTENLSIQSKNRVVGKMLDMASVGRHDVVYVLGCGDGRGVVAAARWNGARGVCVDADAERLRANC